MKTKESGESQINGNNFQLKPGHGAEPTTIYISKVTILLVSSRASGLTILSRSLARLRF